MRKVIRVFVSRAFYSPRPPRRPAFPQESSTLPNGVTQGGRRRTRNSKIDSNTSPSSPPPKDLHSHLTFPKLFPSLQSRIADGKLHDDSEKKNDCSIFNHHAEYPQRINHAVHALFAFPKSPKVLQLSCNDPGANEYLNTMVFKAFKDIDSISLVPISFNDFSTALQSYSTLLNDSDKEEDNNEDDDESNDEEDEGHVISMDTSTFKELVEGLGKASEINGEKLNVGTIATALLGGEGGQAWNRAEETRRLRANLQDMLEKLFKQLAEEEQKRIVLHFQDVSVDGRVDENGFKQLLIAETSKYPNIAVIFSQTPSLHNRPNRNPNANVSNNNRQITLHIQPPPISQIGVLTQWKTQMSQGRHKRILENNLAELKKISKELGITVSNWHKLEVLKQKHVLCNNLIPTDSLHHSLMLSLGQSLSTAQSQTVEAESLLSNLNIHDETTSHSHSHSHSHTNSNTNNTDLKSLERQLNNYEKRLLPTIVSPNATRVRFRDIAALHGTKEALQTLIALPLLRPSLFQYGVLKDSVSGVLLFGPPGTGKTMLAKAVAAECGSNFMSITSSVLYNMYVGEGEKNAKAIFTLARKLAPCVIFIDEVDSIFDSRDNSRSFATKREVINELMSEWDGLTSQNSGVIVVGATNRPFDLDDAILRRMPRRLMVDLPSVGEREQILKIQLGTEQLEESVSLSQLAEKTKFFSGSDLKNLCMNAALQAVREQLQSEMTITRDDNTFHDSNILNSEGLLNIVPEHSPDASKERRVLTGKHFERALAEISSSVKEYQENLEQLRRWNEKFGDGASQSKASMRRFGF